MLKGLHDYAPSIFEYIKHFFYQLLRITFFVRLVEHE